MKFLSITFAGALALSAVGGAVAVAPDDSGNPNKQYVCHHTASEKNPVVIINVGNPAVNAHVVSPSHNHSNGGHQDRDSDNRPVSTADCGEGPAE